MRWRSCLWVFLGCVVLWASAMSAATIVVNPGESIQAAINAASPGDTIQLAAGTHDVTQTVVINKAVTVAAAGAVTVRGSSVSARCVFEIAASSAAICGLDVTWTADVLAATGTGLAETVDALIRVVGSGLSGVSIMNNAIHAPSQAGAMSTWVGRALTVVGSACSGGITISGNAVYNTRNGIVVQYGNTALITNNDIYNTKGGVMNYTSNQADADLRTMSGNTWGTVHNEWDIVWNSGGTYFTPDYHQSVYELSLANNAAYVVDRRDNNAPAYNALGNRSHVFVSTTGTATIGEVNGNMNVPYAGLASAIDAVVTGGIIYVAAGDYVGQAFVGRDMDLMASPGASLKAPTTGTPVTIAETTSVFSPIVFVYGGTMDGAKKVAGTGITTADVTGFDIDGQNKATASPRFVGILLRNAEGTISGNTIHDMYDADGQGNGPQTFGVLVYGDSDVSLLANVISEFSRGGIGVVGDLVGSSYVRGSALDPNALIQGNTVVGNGYEAGANWWAENGIQIGYGAAGKILDNLVTNCRVNNPSWSSTGILIVGSDNVLVAGNTANGNDNGIAIMGLTAWGGIAATGNTLESNDVTGNQWGIGLQYDAVDTAITGNVITGNAGEGVYAYGDGGSAEPYGTILRYNVISGNGYGLVNWGVLGAMDAILNWWGASNGPAYDADFDGTPEYSGSGDSIYGNVIFSPWLGTNPDGSAGLAGVQITGPVLIVVDDVGPAPAGGYLDAAIGGSNSATLAYEDTIQVLDGSFTASTPITDGVTLLSQNGAEQTTINGSLLLNSANVIIGRMGNGFSIHSPITVGAGVDASTIHINWNDIYVAVANSGAGWLDATYNYWGANGPDTVGLVDVYPYLPVTTSTLIGYVNEYGYAVGEAITFAELLVAGTPLSEAELIVLLTTEFGLSTEEAATLINEYGRAEVNRAAIAATDLADLMLHLVGYATSLPSGGAGGGAGGDLGGYPVGTVVPLFLAVADPFTGEDATDALVTYTLSRFLDGGILEIVRFGVMAYDATAGGFSFALDTTGLAAGEYDVYLGTDDGQSVTYKILLTE